MTNANDLKALEVLAPWNDQVEIERLPDPETLTAGLLNKINDYARVNEKLDLRYWTIQGKTASDSYDKFFAETWDETRRFRSNPRADSFLDECINSELPLEVEAALIANAHHLSLHFDEDRVARIWFELTTDQKDRLIGYVNLNREIATDALNLGLASRTLIPWANTTTELDRLTDAINVYWNSDEVIESNHFAESTAIKLLQSEDDPRHAIEIFREINTKYPQIASSLWGGVERPTPDSAEAPADLALEVKRVGRRKGTSLRTIVEAEIPYRIFAKPYKALQAKIAKGGDHVEIDQAILDATNDYLMGVQLLKDFADKA